MPAIFHLQQQHQFNHENTHPRSASVNDATFELHQLKSQVQFQVEYFLRSYAEGCDSAGWMPVSDIIASRRIKNLTKDIEIIMEAITDFPLFEHDPDLDMIRIRRVGSDDSRNRSSLSTLGPHVSNPSEPQLDNGYQAQLSQEDKQFLILKALTNKTKRVRRFFVPKVMPFELLFFRKIFSFLCEAQNTTTDQDELPIQAFQRAFERFFRLLRDPRGFNCYEYDQDGNGYVGWGEFFYVFQHRAIVIHLNTFERVFLTLDDPEESSLGTLVSFFLLIMIAISSMGFILSTIPAMQIAPGVPLPIFDSLEVACLTIFVSEYLLRLLTVWTVRHELFDRPKLIKLVVGNDPIRLSTPLSRIVRFMLQPSNVIDLAAILPPFVGLLLPEADSSSFVVLRLIRLTRIFRAFRNPKLAEPGIVIGRTLQQSTKALYVLAFNLMLGILISSSLMWWAEKGIWDDEAHTYVRRVGSRWNHTTNEFEDIYAESPFTSIPQSMWWSIVTVCTVGYGDQVPVTPLGHAVAGLTMLFSLVILALPVGVIGGNFSSVWQHFNDEKKNDGDQNKRDMDSLTNAIQFIAPATLRKIIVVEVWNDRLPIEESETENFTARNPEGVLGRPDPAEFMGEAKLELDFLPTQCLKITKTIKLEANPGLVRRAISGFITVGIEWTPKAGSSKRHVMRCKSNGAIVSATLAPGAFPELLGNLRVTILHGEQLVNLNWRSEKSLSNPYCTVTCYPEAPRVGKEVAPHVWRSPTAQNTLNPKWGSPYFDFDFTWTQEKYLNEETVGSRKSQSRRISDSWREAESELTATTPSEQQDRHKASINSIESTSTRVVGVKNTPGMVDDEPRHFEVDAPMLLEAPTPPAREAPVLDTHTLQIPENFGLNVAKRDDMVEFLKSLNQMQVGFTMIPSVHSITQVVQSPTRSSKGFALRGMPDGDILRQASCQGSIDELFHSSYLKEVMV